MKKFIANLILKLGGFKMVGDFPKDEKKFVLLAAPHTSNWDFVYGRAAMLLYNINLKYLIKDSYFKGPMKFFFAATGGLPVDRSKKNNMVDYMIDLFNSSNELALMVPAEGTRKRVERWKTGFYHVAVGANIPILLGFLDYKKREAGFGTLFYPTGDKEKDFAFIEQFYLDKEGKHPELYNKKIY